ncbi:MAG: ABC transporter substrate-binding protein [Planctomycetota bacterium]
MVLGPSTVENLFALGLGDRVAGVSDYCGAPGAEGIARLGGQLNPNLESLAALQPDLVLTQGTLPELEGFCRRQGFPLLSLATDTWAGWQAEIGRLGTLFGVEERAGRLVDKARKEMAALAADRDPSRPPTPALLVVGRRAGEAGGLVVAGRASFLSELLAFAGGRNVFADNRRDYFDLAEEALVRAAPEVIFELRPGSSETKAQVLHAWQAGFPALPAVRFGRVVLLTQDFILLPGPRMPAIAALLAEGLASRH